MSDAVAALPGAEPRTVDLPQGPVTYREFGSGPVLVFVHGAFVDGRLWDGVVASLCDRFRCVVPDLPLGAHRNPLHPDADISPDGAAAILAAFVTALGLDRVTLVANDTGGAVSQLVAARRPDWLVGMVLTSCDTFEYFPPPLFQWLRIVTYVPGLVWLFSRIMRWPRLWNTPLTFGWMSWTPLPRALVGSWLQPVLRDPAVRRDAIKFARGTVDKPLVKAAAELARFPGPVLVAWAEDDRFFPVDHGRRLAAALPNSEFRLVPGSRTFVPLDQPGKLTELIVSFLRT